MEFPPNPFDKEDIKRIGGTFDGNNGNYPNLYPVEGGGIEYVTISGRSIKITLDNDGQWRLDCSSWWSSSKIFQATILDALEVMASYKLEDNIPLSYFDRNVNFEEIFGRVSLGNFGQPELDDLAYILFDGKLPDGYTRFPLKISYGDMDIDADYESVWYGGKNSGGWVGFKDYADKLKEGETKGVKWEFWQVGRHYFNQSSFSHNYDRCEDTGDWYLCINGGVKVTDAEVSDNQEVVKILQFAGIPTKKKDFMEAWNLDITGESIPTPYSQYYGGENSGGNVGISIETRYEGPEGKVIESRSFNESTFDHDVDKIRPAIHIVLRSGAPVIDMSRMWAVL
ncbi:MAG: hypothetical protein WC863_00445 [Patescibacteria group bacterium]